MIRVRFEKPKPAAPKSDDLVRVPGRSLPEGRSWKPHTGIKARIRNLTNHCRPVLLSKDPVIVEQLEQLKELTKNSPIPIIEICHVIFKVMELSKETGIPVAEGLVLAIEGLKEAPIVEEDPSAVREEPSKD
jgi:hypothetical protein